MVFSALPNAQGLYDPANEADSCGVAMIADIQGRRSHGIDGAGILLQLPVELLSRVVDFALPAPAADGTSTFAAGICFLPQDPVARQVAHERVEAIAVEGGLQVLGWRVVPVDPEGAGIGMTALSCMPYIA